MATAVVSIIMLLLGCVPLAAAGPGATFYVNPRGNDSWTGRSPLLKAPSGPLATPQAARDAIRQLKQAGPLPSHVTVELASGVYELVRPLELTAADSGTEACPITYRAQARTEVRLVGGKVLGHWKAVTDPSILPQLDPAARGKVLCTDLRAQGINDFGVVAKRPEVVAGLPAELFFADQPMTLARWPNSGFVMIEELRVAHPHEVPRTAERQDRRLHLRGRPLEALAHREGTVAARLLVLGLGRRARTGGGDRPADRRHPHGLAPPPLRLPYWSAVLRSQHAFRD